MTTLSLFGLCAVTLMLVAYALEHRSPWFVLLFAAACALGSAYGFLQGAWPFGVVEAVWAVVALRRWRRAAKAAESSGSDHSSQWLVAALGDEKIPEHPRAHDADARVLFQIEQI